jgi:hypothetical protein
MGKAYQVLGVRLPSDPADYRDSNPANPGHLAMDGESRLSGSKDKVR